MKYRYETHLHTSPVSACSRSSVEESVRAYKELGYAGLFITNHFIGGNIAKEVRGQSYVEQLEFYYGAYVEGKRIGDEIGIDVFFAIETSYKGTDFLVYGLDIDWYRAHPEIMEMTKKEQLAFMKAEGALLIQAHPFREASYIDHIRLYPRDVEGVEIINSSRAPEENEMARMYAEHYGLIPFAGSDNHKGPDHKVFAGMESDTPIKDVADFVRQVRDGEMQVFVFTPEK